MEAVDTSYQEVVAYIQSMGRLKVVAKEVLQQVPKIAFAMEEVLWKSDKIKVGSY